MHQLFKIIVLFNIRNNNAVSDTLGIPHFSEAHAFILEYMKKG